MYLFKCPKTSSLSGATFDPKLFYHSQWIFKYHYDFMFKDKLKSSWKSIEEKMSSM